MIPANFPATPTNFLVIPTVCYVKKKRVVGALSGLSGLSGGLSEGLSGK